jgi:hypothetical protein
MERSYHGHGAGLATLARSRRRRGVFGVSVLAALVLLALPGLSSGDPTICDTTTLVGSAECPGGGVLPSLPAPPSLPAQPDPRADLDGPSSGPSISANDR